MSEQKKPIVVGDLVTVNLSEFHAVSNTYQVWAKLGEQSLLSHPLASDCYIIKNDSELNNTFPSMQSQVEKCMFFAKKNREMLGYTMAADLDALCYYFVVKKELTPKQRHDLANICGKIASIILNNNISNAIVTIKQNHILLDEYTTSLLNSIRKVYDNPMTLKSKGERYTIFNIAGFALAQLANN